MSENDVNIQAEVATAEGAAHSPGNDDPAELAGAEEREQTPPPSMAPGSGYDPDVPKVHQSPEKEASAAEQDPDA